MNENKQVYYGGELPAAVKTFNYPSLQTNTRYAKSLANQLYSGNIEWKNIPYKYRRYIQGELAGKSVAEGRDKFATKVMPVVLGTAFGPAGAVSALAGEAVNMGVNAATKGEKDSWGDLFANPESHPYWNTFWQFTNPGYLTVGPLESGLKNTATDAGVAAIKGQGKRFLNDEIKQFGKNIERSEISSIPEPVVKNILAGKLGWEPAHNTTIWHNSETPISKLEVNYPAWDISKRNSPLGHVWGTSSETTEGFIGARPYHNHSVKPVELKKPIVQLNEAIGNGKNSTRNDILDFTQQSGADATHFKNIKDNTLENQDVYAVFKDIDLVDPKVKKLDGYKGIDFDIDLSELDKEMTELDKEIKNKSFGMPKSESESAKYKYNSKTGEFEIQRPLKKWMQVAEEMVDDYYYSPDEFMRLRRQGLNPKEALKIMRTRRFNIEHRRPSRIVPLRKDLYGDSQTINSLPLIRYNSRKNLINSFDDMLSIAGHELGGHGASLNIGDRTTTIAPWLVDDLTAIYKHNETLRPELLPLWKSIKVGDTSNVAKLAEEMGFKSIKQTNKDNLKQLQDYIKYMERNQEYTARAISTNISKSYGNKHNWNESQLRQMFTPESIDNLLKNVRGVAIPTIGGATIGAGLTQK